jgi:hypothetical protein
MSALRSKKTSLNTKNNKKNKSKKDEIEYESDDSDDSSSDSESPDSSDSDSESSIRKTVKLTSREHLKEMRRRSKLRLTKAEKWKFGDDVVKSVAKFIIKNNIYRYDVEGGDSGDDISFYGYKDSELQAIQDAYRGNEPLEDGVLIIDGGYAYLDHPDGTEGFVRLYSGQCNPKYVFWVEKGKLKYQGA